MRTWNTAAQALLARLEAGEQIPWTQLVQLDLDVVQRYSTSGVAQEWDGFTWQPLGVYVGAIDDSAAEFTQLTLTLPAVTEAQLALGLVTDVEGRRVQVYDAIVDPDTGLVADARLAWVGVMDQPTIEDGPTAAMTITAEHRGSTAVRPKPTRYTNDEQQRLYPGDWSLDQDPATDAAPEPWPTASYFQK